MLPIVPTYKVTTLYTKAITEDGFPFNRIYFYERRYGNRQAPPYNINTLCSYVRGVCTDVTCFQDMNAIPYTALIEQLQVDALNSARADFVRQVGQSSQFGSTATAEAKSTYGTVVLGIAKALKAARLVARGRIPEAGKLLGFAPPVVRKSVRRTYPVKGRKRRKTMRVYREYWVMPDKRLVARSLGSKWLWYSYGVKPLIQDLHNASQVFVREIPMTKVIGRSSTGASTTPGVDVYHHTVKVKVVANVRVSNPNTYLASQLGLLNPIQWANEAIPLSFVADWFSNWSDWINQLTDLAGLSIVNPTTSIATHTTQVYAGGYWKFKASYFTYDRILSVPSVKLTFGFERVNWQRGLNAISLLTQLLKSNMR